MKMKQYGGFWFYISDFKWDNDACEGNVNGFHGSVKGTEFQNKEDAENALINAAIKQWGINCVLFGM